MVHDGAAARVLVVDDEPELRMPLAEDFERHGFAWQAAGDALFARHPNGR